MDKVIDAFQKEGILGFIIIALGLTIVYLFKQYKEIQEKRIAENRETTKAIEQNTNTLETLSEVLRHRLNS